MSDAFRPAMGRIAWVDLTVPDAVQVSDFYSAVVGWTAQPVAVGDYSDFYVGPADGGMPVAGICHARGVNEGLPAQWLLYVQVASLDVSLLQCREHGGRVIYGPRDMGEHGRFAVIQDPAGAVLALMEPPANGATA